MTLKIRCGLILAWLLALSAQPSLTQAAGGTVVYLPLVTRNYNPLAGQRTVNAPYFSDLVVNQPCPGGPTPPWCIQRFSEMAVTWFGKITPNDNYVDVRVAYNDTELIVYLALIDRYIWFDTSPAANDLLDWDSVSLYLNQSGNSGVAPTTSAYRFDVQYSGGLNTAYQAAYRGNGAGWASAGLPFSTFTTDRWESGPPNGGTSKGWAAHVRIPFSSLGLAGRPADGTVWGMGVKNRDRDTQSGSTLAEKVWPESLDNQAPGSWARLRFGLPGYSAPGASTTTTIRQGVSGAITPDGGVGGYANCGGSLDYWTQWGEAVYFLNEVGEEHGDINIQNQADISDWPCFSKYYITFPLTGVPAGRVIRSATLKLYHFGNSQPADAKPSYIQVLTVGTDFSETTLNWNNGPLPLENVSVAKVDPLPGFSGFPAPERVWDLSRAVALAYSSGQPLRLVLYSADSDYHSGKYFVSADTGDWNNEGRPKLEVNWGNP